MHAPAGVSLSVGSLQAAVRRIRAEVVGPHAAIASRVAALQRTHAAMALLRATVQHLKLAAKLRALMASQPLDLAKAAKLVAEIRAVGAETDLSGERAVAPLPRVLRVAPCNKRSVMCDERRVKGGGERSLLVKLRPITTNSCYA